MSYTLVSTSNFDRGLKRLSKEEQPRARRTLEEIVKDPFSSKQLRGKYQEIRSARWGNYRILYVVGEDKKEIFLLAVEPRSTAYHR